MRLILARGPSTQVKTPLLALPLFSDHLPTRGHTGQCDWRLDGAIAGLVLEGKVAGHLGQKAMIGGAYRVGAERLLVYGLGPSSKMSPVGLQQAVVLLGEDVAKLKLPSWSVGIIGRDLPNISFRDAAASTLRGILHSTRGEVAVRFIEEETERFGLLVREVPKWLQAMASTYGPLGELVLEDEAG